MRSDARCSNASATALSTPAWAPATRTFALPVCSETGRNGKHSKSSPRDRLAGEDAPGSLDMEPGGELERRRT